MVMLDVFEVGYASIFLSMLCRAHFRLNLTTLLRGPCGGRWLVHTISVAEAICSRILMHSVPICFTVEKTLRIVISTVNGIQSLRCLSCRSSQEHIHPPTALICPSSGYHLLLCIATGTEMLHLDHGFTSSSCLSKGSCRLDARHLDKVPSHSLASSY
jgi:hypothetical protein